ncbi:MAG: saccharopine dehydrogenase family protein [Myxococcaceae bacterium]
MASTTGRWMLYGATGYTGQLIAQEAVRRGQTPILAGRSQAKLLTLAASLGLEHRTVGLDDPAALRRALEGVKVVLHAAGPFVETSAPMLRACLDVGVSYLDITGELPVFRSAFAHHEEAERKGVAVICGVGFDVVPTDCLARHLSDRLPRATELEIAIAAIGNPSAGTAKSALGQLPEGACSRRGGAVVSEPVGKGVRRVRFSDHERWVVPAPLADLETAYRSTGIPNVTAYFAIPRNLARALKLAWPLGAAVSMVGSRVASNSTFQKLMTRLIEKRFHGPDETRRRASRSYVWARVAGPGGAEAQAWLETAEGYQFTAMSSVRAVEAVLEKKPVGATTPSLAFGWDFVLGIEGTRLVEGLPAGAARVQAPSAGYRKTVPRR